jgi:hypothetical protein
LSSIEWPASLDLSSHSTILESLKTDGNYTISDPILAADLNIGAVLSLDNNSVVIDQLEHKPRIEIANQDEVRSLPYPTNNRPSNLSFNVTTKKDASIIIRDSFYPGWHAYLDNQQEIPIHNYLLIFRRLFVPAGNHTITLKYKPLPLYFGIFLSSLAGLIVLISHRHYLFRLFLNFHAFLLAATPPTTKD